MPRIFSGGNHGLTKTALLPIQPEKEVVQKMLYWKAIKNIRAKRSKQNMEENLLLSIGTSESLFFFEIGTSESSMHGAKNNFSKWKAMKNFS